MEIILKYKNRKLYSKTKKGYVSLAEIITKIKNDELFQVIDYETNTDVTNQTLKQALINTKISNDTIIRIVLGLSLT
jgi:polyhydroxyalkanoate synthesis regulator protein